MAPAHILSVLVENKRGVLNRVASLLRRRMFNIDSLTVGPSEKKGFSRMTIALPAETRVDMALAQMQKLIEVVDVHLLKDPLIRETILISCPSEEAAQLLAKRCGGHTEGTTVILTATPERIEACVTEAKKLKAKKIIRSGIVAL